MTCPEKMNDLAGCRCQAFLLTGDAESADPVCSLSPNHHLIEKAIEDSKNPVLASQPIIFRTDKNSKKYVAGDRERVEEFHALALSYSTVIIKAHCNDALFLFLE